LFKVPCTLLKAFPSHKTKTSQTRIPKSRLVAIGFTVCHMTLTIHNRARLITMSHSIFYIPEMSQSFFYNFDRQLHDKLVNIS
jgi:hypothetical protein